MKGKLQNWIQASKNDPQAAIANSGMVLYLCVYTLILHNRLFDLIRTRLTCFLVITIIMGLSLLVTQILQNKRHAKRMIRPSTAVEICDLFFILLLICSVTACLLSANPEFALTGKGARSMGTLTILLLFCAYRILSRNLKMMHLFLYALGFAVVVSVAIGYLQFAGFDPLHLMQNVRMGTQKNFISVFGNLNNFSSFLCLAAPVHMTVYCCSKKEDPFFALMAYVICCIGLFIANSDSGYIGFACAFVVVCLISLRHSACAFRRWIKLLLAFCVTAKSFSIVYYLGHGSLRTISRITRTITFGYTPIFVIALCAILLLLTKERNPSERFRNIAFFAVLGTCALVAIGLIGIIAYFTTVGAERDIGYWSRYLRFDDLWGTGRGFIWRYMFKIFADQTWYRKLFGIGADTIGRYMKEHYRYEMYAAGYSLIDSAHNEPLQYLVTHGIVGLLAYLGFSFLGVLFPLLRKEAKTHPLNMAFAAGALCYLAQSVVNQHQAITTPLYYVFVAAAMSGNMILFKKSAVKQETRLE